MGYVEFVYIDSKLGAEFIGFFLVPIGRVDRLFFLERTVHA